MAMDEVIRTTGDVRRMLAQTMTDLRAKRVTAADATAMSALAKELTANMQVEINAVKVNLALGEHGKSIGRITNMGKMLIEDGSTPTLSGACDE